MNFRQFFRKTIRIIFPLFLGCLLLWYLYQGQDWGEMMKVIRKGIRYDILLFSLIFGLGGNIIRGYRWGLLIDSLGERVRRINVVLAVMGNYAINLVLPRIGEVWRCGITSKYENVPFTKLIGTMLVDRVMDTFVVGVTAILVFSFNISFFSRYFSNNPEFIDGFFALFSSTWMYVSLLVLILVIWLFFKMWGHLAFVKKARGAVKDIWEGIKSLWKLEHKVLFIFQTIMIWICYFLYFYMTFYAFDFTGHLGIRIGLIAFIMSSIGVAVPVQGGIGVWHFMVISTLVSFGVSDIDAGTFALVVYAVQTMWVIISGLAGVIALPLVNQNKAIRETERVKSAGK